MTDWLAHAPAFIAGWAGCCAFIALAEWITFVRERELDHFEPFDEPHGDIVPWPTDFERPHSASVTAKGEQDHV